MDLTARELAEAAWMRARIGEARVVTRMVAVAPDVGDAAPLVGPTLPGERVAVEVEAEIGAPAARSSSPAVRAELHLVAAPALPDLVMRRALHRLARHGPGGRDLLDALASVRRSAELDDVELVHRPRAEAKTTLVVFEDLAGQIEPWRAEIGRLVKQARSSGDFAAVHHRTVGADGVVMGPEGPSRLPRLGEPDGTVLVLLVGDGFGMPIEGAWLRRELALARGEVRVVWVQPYPRVSWHRTPVFSLRATPPRPLGEEATAALVSMDVGGWAALHAWATGRSARGVDGLRLPERRRVGAGVVDAERFRADASVPSLLALGLVAAVPGHVDLELLTALTREFGAEAIGREHLTEALGSGLLRRVEGGEGLVATLRSEELRRAVLAWLQPETVRRVLHFLVRALGSGRRDVRHLEIPLALIFRALRGEGELEGEGTEETRAALRAILELAKVEVPEGVFGAAPGEGLGVEVSVEPRVRVFVSLQGEGSWDPAWNSLWDVLQKRGFVLESSDREHAGLVSVAHVAITDGHDADVVLVLQQPGHVWPASIWVAAIPQGVPVRVLPATPLGPSPVWTDLLEDLRQMARTPRPGHLLGGRYRLEQELGGRAWTNAWLGTDVAYPDSSDTSHKVVIKLLRDKMADDPVTLRQFFACRSHIPAGLPDAIIDVSDAGLARGGLWAWHVRPSQGGLSLHEALGHGAVDGRTLVLGLWPVVRALERAHQQGSVHLRVSPLALWWNQKSQTARLSYWYAAQAFGDSIRHRFAPEPGFAAPEVMDGRYVGPSADVYALAATLVASLAGGQSDGEQQPLGILEGLEIPDGAERALREALQPDPERRTASVAQLWTAVDAAFRASTRLVRPGEVVHSALRECRPPLDLAFIPAGEFLMGRPPKPAAGSMDARTSRDHELPQHRVAVSAFRMAVHPVTQAQYRAVMGTNPSRHQGDDLPVEQVSWLDAVAFCNALSRSEDRPEAYRQEGGRQVCDWEADGYRLPTEAEWEYACRASTTTAFWSGDTKADLDRVGWFSGNSGNETHPVGGKPANPWGLHDMHGNVREWCWDRYDSGGYGRPPPLSRDPHGTERGVLRVRRGGSYRNVADGCRSAYRSGVEPGYRRSYIGFRVVLGGAVASPSDF